MAQSRLCPVACGEDGRCRIELAAARSTRARAPRRRRPVAREAAEIAALVEVRSQPLSCCKAARRNEGLALTVFASRQPGERRLREIDEGAPANGSPPPRTLAPAPAQPPVRGAGRETLRSALAACAARANAPPPSGRPHRLFDGPALRPRSAGAPPPLRGPLGRGADDPRSDRRRIRHRLRRTAAPPRPLRPDASAPAALSPTRNSSGPPR